MKTLFLLRHCKAGGTPANAGDHDRTLNEAGVKDAQVVGRYLENTGAAPRLALCSTALRALETFEIVAQALSGGITAKSERALYSTTAGGILESIRATDAEETQLLMIGHVPAIQELAIALCGVGTAPLRSALAAGFSSGTLAVLDFDTADWTGVGLRAGTLKEFITPEQMPKS